MNCFHQTFQHSRSSEEVLLYNKLLQFLPFAMNQLKVLNPGDVLILDKEDNQPVKDTIRFRVNRKKT